MIPTLLPLTGLPQVSAELQEHRPQKGRLSEVIEAFVARYGPQDPLFNWSSISSTRGEDRGGVQ